MGIWEWIAQHAFNLGDIGIILGLVFTGISLHSETKTRRITNLLSLTQNHRELWSDFFRRPGLARILDVTTDVLKQPVTRDEEIFVNMVIQHLHSVYQAMHDRLVIKPEGVRQDVRSFFSLPIPNVVWGKLKPLQDEKFVKFVEDARFEN